MNAEHGRPESLKNEPVAMTPERRAGFDFVNAAVEAAMRPERVADIVFAAIQNEQFYIVTHPEWMEAVQMRTEDLLRMGNPRSPVQAMVKLMRLGTVTD